jgi:uncharacterized OB-fold protein
MEPYLDHAGRDWSETPAWAVPVPNDEDREFFAGARRGELRIQRCEACGLHQHYPRYLCIHCGSERVGFVTASGLGTVYSYTVIRQNGVPPFRDRVPFVVAVIDLDEPGARIIASMPKVAPEAAQVGMRVLAAFRAASDEVGLVDFEAAGA